MIHPQPSVPVPDWVSFTHVLLKHEGDIITGSFTAVQEGEDVGLLRYEVNTKTKIAKIKYLGVVTRCRKQGLGSALVQELHREYPDYLVDPGTSRSQDGENLKQTLLRIRGVKELAAPWVT